MVPCRKRGVVAVVRADLIQQFSYGEDLAHGADEKMVIRLQIYQHGSAAGIDDAQSPLAAFVMGLVQTAHGCPPAHCCR
jgi:hypothetical protein